MNPIKTTTEIFNQYALDYQTKFMDVGLYHSSFDLFCSHTPKAHAQVLEIACGPGNITRYLLEKRPDFKILGIDLAEKMVELAKINNPTAEFVVMDCRDIHLLNQQYDAIMCGFCLPYLSKEDAIKLIKDASDLLSPNGVLYLSTMEDDYNKSSLQTSSSGDQTFMYFHQADYLVQALEENGFKIISLSRQDYPAKEDAKIIDLLILAGK